MRRNRHISTLPMRITKLAIVASLPLAVICLMVCITLSTSASGDTESSITAETASPVLMRTAIHCIPDDSNYVRVVPKEIAPAAEETTSPVVVNEPVEETVEEAVASEPVEENDASTNPYSDLSLTFDEKELLARMAYSEARGEGFDGQVAVIQVALNRYMHEAYSGSISDILLAPNQFSVGNTYTEEQMQAVEDALAGNPVLDLNTDVVFFSTGGLDYGTYYCTIGGHVFRTYH